ncbi:MAG: HEAT repeat domain-containing protein [Candidatus Micrarchaeota archaeon]
MGILDEIRGSNKKPKELILFLAEKTKHHPDLFMQLIDGLKIGSKAEKGTCLSVVAHVAKDNPELVIPYLDHITEYINHDAPRVRWEAAEVIANIAQKFPDKVSKTIPNLLLNTTDEGTVVRWSAAYALTEIAKNHPKTQKELVPRFLEIIRKETNSGVKNVYLKALDALGVSPSKG